MIKTQEKDKTDKVPEELNTRRQSTLSPSKCWRKNTNKLEFSVHLNYHFKVREKNKDIFRIIENVGV